MAVPLIVEQRQQAAQRDAQRPERRSRTSRARTMTSTTANSEVAATTNDMRASCGKGKARRQRGGGLG